MVLRVLADLRIVRIADLSIVKEVIDDRAEELTPAALMTFVET